MTIKKNLENHVRGWLPKEPVIYSIKQASTASKVLVAYFILLFTIGILLRIFVTPLFLPGTAEITDRSIVMFIVVGVLLTGVYYLKTQGSLKQIRTIYALGVALPIGFAIYVIVSIVIRTVTGTVSQGGSEFLLIIMFGYTIGFIIGIPVSKEIQKRSPGRF